MTQADRLAHLDNALAALQAAMGWLSRSSQRCRDIDPVGPLSETDFDALENLTSRFARAVDLLIHKVYRAMDAVELDAGGSTLDVVNRAHKRGLFDDPERIRELKDVRNEIAHEYILADVRELFATVKALVPELDEAARRATAYRKNYPADHPA
ncbi:hypothetical protein GTA51_10130 [Desulfovibrio aerotolerans]|uniref:DUF86 domain-containing protein n=1 Tax=Solidesulfovibrio aerotolerans TaxID=295255 RepID=A0A7C9IL18_9BACT|nr:HepT-like ribonuclease domain-containing protein [Solidesulfovibrio aerotolerans]MYL83481.1 hypothetical protein [Solidesulfovibrio aerotolerans]